MSKQSKQTIMGALLILFALLLSASAQPQTIVGKVVAIADGDTLTVLDSNNQQQKIRLDGIDAPESHQDYGSRAKQSLSDLVFGKTVTVISSKKDRYGRTLGKVTLDGKDINLEQIRSGMAWFYRQYAKELSPEDAKAYEKAEIAAKYDALGLWREPNPIPPWFFRRGERAGAVKAPSAQPTTPATGAIIGNRNSKIYHRSDCPDYNRVSERNRVSFKTEGEAQTAGYRRAKNCP